MWETVEFNKNQIKAETERAILLNCPHSSYYDGYSFWIPLSFVREGNRGNTLIFAYPENFEFTLRKYGKGKYNKRDVIDEVVICGDDIKDIYSGIYCGKKEVVYNPFETHKPEPLKAEHSEALGDLLDE